jgi:hypothetical protein
MQGTSGYGNGGGVDAGVRRMESPDAGGGVRPEASSAAYPGWDGAGRDPSSALGSPVDPRSAAAVAPQPEPTDLNIGRRAQLPRRLVEQAILKHLADLCKARGVQVPADQIDFLNRAKIYFLDGQGKAVSLASAMVTWEEG